MGWICSGGGEGDERDGMRGKISLEPRAGEVGTHLVRREARLPGATETSERAVPAGLCQFVSPSTRVVLLGVRSSRNASIAVDRGGMQCGASVITSRK